MLQADTIFGGTYRLDRALGKGGMGEVWLAHHLLLNEPRAIKIMLGPLASNAIVRERFIKGEARNALRLERHPHLVRVYELGLHETMPYIVMEYVESGANGADLKEMLSMRGKLSPEEAGIILSQIASALEVAHRQGMIHRDIKPGNILIAGDSRKDRSSMPMPPSLFAKLTDFGLTKDVEAGVELTLTGFSMGTPVYMAPEQAQGRSEIRSDVYALGAVLYEMLVGRPPFVGNAASLILQHATQNPVPPQQIEPNVPNAIGLVVMRALAKRPEDRYESATELAKAYQQALQDWQDRESSHTVMMATPVPLAGPANRTLPADPPPVKVAATPSAGSEPARGSRESLVRLSESLKAPGRPPNNLALQLTSFVGREREVAQVKTLLSTTRLLTLTGAGGTGKTRLSLQVGADLLDEYPDGVWLVELAPLNDASLVAATVAASLMVREEVGQTMHSTLVEYLRDKSLLIVLDNCEHVVAACAKVAETLLRSCPKIQILASSREALEIGGETTWRVPSLSLPSVAEWSNPNHLPPLEKLTQYEAVKLFIERATSVQPNFTVTNQNAPALAQLCQQLDGIPLALELAAARVKAMSVDQIASRLDNRFRLLTGGSRTALPRQQTLKALIDWSYDLLSETERVLLRRLSAFAGGWQLEAAEAVCSGEELEDFEVMDYLIQLVNKSLVVTEDQENKGYPGETRYRMLESIRQYSQEKLIESGDESQVRRKHAAHFLSLVEEAEIKIRGAEQSTWLERLELEHDNVRAALRSSLEAAAKGAGFDDAAPEPEELALRLSGALWLFWEVRGHRSEGRKLLDQALTTARTSGVSQMVLSKALNGAGNLARAQSDYPKASSFFEESLEIREQLGDKKLVSFSLTNLGTVAYLQGNYEKALSYLEKSLALQKELNDKASSAETLNTLAAVAHAQGDYTQATAFFEESLKLRRQLGDKHGKFLALVNLGEVARDMNDYSRATIFLEEALTVSREIGNNHSSALVLNNLAWIALLQGDYKRANNLVAESLPVFDEYEDKRSLADCLEILAGLAAAQESTDPSRAVKLLGAAEALRQTIGSPLTSADRVKYDQITTQSRTRLDEAAFAAAWSHGQGIPPEDLLIFALERA